MAAYKDYYAVLGIARDADDKAVRRAFRQLAAKHHPDRNPDDPQAEERFKEINEAYTVLSDTEKRAFYDRYGSDPGAAATQGAGSPGGGFSGGFSGGFPGGGFSARRMDADDVAGFSDFFRSLFGGGMPGGFTTGQAAPRYAPLRRDAEAALSVSLEQAFHGGPVGIRVEDRGLDVNLPAGARDGAKLRLRGQAPGGGDLLLVVRHAPDPVWSLNGDQLTRKLDVADHLAAIGGPIKVPTFEGDLEVSVPAGSASGRKLRLRGRGWPTRDGGRGDLLVELRLVVPKELSDEQRQLYQRLAELAEGA